MANDLARLASAASSAMLVAFRVGGSRLFALPPLPRTIAAALRDIEASRADVRRSALVDLVRYADTENRPIVVEAIVRILRQDPDVEVRATAAMATADAMLSELVSHLLDALDDSAPRVKQVALLALGALRPAADSIDSDRIEVLLASEAPALRYQALIAWRRIKREAGLEQLVRAIADPDEEVRWIAWSLIEEQLEGPHDHPNLDDGGEGGISDGARSCSLGPEAAKELAERLVSHLDDVTLRIRIIAASVMARLGDDRHLGRLLDTLENTSVRLSNDELLDAIHCFERLRYQPAQHWLARRARRGWFEGTVGWPATVALAALGDPQAEAAILSELNTRSARRRSRALHAIRSLRLTRAAEQVRALAQHAPGVESWLVRETLTAIDVNDTARELEREE